MSPLLLFHQAPERHYRLAEGGFPGQIKVLQHHLDGGFVAQCRSIRVCEWECSHITRHIVEPGCSHTGFWDVVGVRTGDLSGHWRQQLGVKKRLEIATWTWGSAALPPASRGVPGWLEHWPGHLESEI